MLREIRNAFAHNIFGCSFENPDVLNELKKVKSAELAGASFNEPRIYFHTAVLILDNALETCNSAKTVQVMLSIKFEVRHFLQMRMNILRWCPIPKSFAWARVSVCPQFHCRASVSRVTWKFVLVSIVVSSHWCFH